MTSGRSSRFGRLKRAFVFSEDGVFTQSESAAEKDVSKTGGTLLCRSNQGTVVRKELRDDKKN